MALLGIDLGGTKIAFMLFSETGHVLFQEKEIIGQRAGAEVGSIIIQKIGSFKDIAKSHGREILAIGISVPGIYYSKKGTVWAPNIKGWEDYPLLEEVKSVSEDIPVVIDSDRACYILGEIWQGNAKGNRDAIFLAVGTGIGAGILINDRILRGSNDIAGAIGWMALQTPFQPEYTGTGCFEYHASGKGLALLAQKYADADDTYSGALKKEPSALTTLDVFTAYEKNDPLAVKIIGECIQFWGMAIANLISLFNPEKIILGGGVFGPALALIPQIKKEADKWAQPISAQQYTIEGSALGNDAGLYGAAYLALKMISTSP